MVHALLQFLLIHEVVLPHKTCNRVVHCANISGKELCHTVILIFSQAFLDTKKWRPVNWLLAIAFKADKDTRLFPCDNKIEETYSFCRA
jgi:hypothetical protein